MIKFTLPNFYYYKNINNVVNYFSHNLEYLNFNFNIIGEEGSLPFFTWNGGPNINYDFVDYYFITELEKIYSLPLIFDCSNINIKDIDLFSVKDNLMLNANMTGANSILVSNYLIMKYLKNKYPYYKFIASEDFLFPEEINRKDVINEFDLFRINNEENIKDYPLNKIEFILPTTSCSICSQFKKCKELEQQSISLFKNKSVFRSCNKHGPYCQESLYLFNKIRNQYHISNFCLETRGMPIVNLEYIINYYLFLFFKPEYHYEIRKKMEANL